MIYLCGNSLGVLPRGAGARVRNTVVAEAGSFRTDLYLFEGVTDLLGGYERRLVNDEAALHNALDDDVAAVLLNHVDYRTGRLRDMAHSPNWHTTAACSRHGTSATAPAR